MRDFCISVYSVSNEISPSQDASTCLKSITGFIFEPIFIATGYQIGYQQIINKLKRLYIKAYVVYKTFLLRMIFMLSYVITSNHTLSSSFTWLLNMTINQDNEPWQHTPKWTKRLRKSASQASSYCYPLMGVWGWSYGLDRDLLARHQQRHSGTGTPTPAPKADTT